MKKYHSVLLIISFLILDNFGINCIVNNTKKGLRVTVSQEKKCQLGCIDCNYNVCKKCLEGFTFYNGKCFDNIKLNNFIAEVSENMEDKQKEILSFLINKIPDNNNNNNQSSMYIDLTKDYNLLKGMLKNIQEWNVRQCRMKINEFVMSFERNMNVLLSLTNFFEEKSLFEIAKIKAKVLELLGNDKVNPSVKFEMISKSLVSLTEIINSIFKEIDGKVGEYERLSQRKIARYREYFYENFKKFFDKTKDEKK